MGYLSFRVAIGVFVWVISAAAQPRVLSGPIADAITPTSARITWITDVASSTIIHYGPTTSYGVVNSGPGPATAHSWYMSGLKPATKYYYKACSTANGVEVCSGQKTVTTIAGTAVSDPQAPKAVSTSMPSGPYGTPLLVDSSCSNLPDVLSTVSKLTGSLHYEIRIPAGTTCLGQYVFPVRPNHSGWVVVRTAAPDSSFAYPGTRVTPQSTAAMARFVTNAIPGSTRVPLGSFGTSCSIGTFARGTDTPGGGLFVCEPQGSSVPKPITGATSSSSGLVITSPGHGYKTGQIVKITATGLGVDNKWWRITVSSSDKFLLEGSAASGTFSGSGTVTRNDAWIEVPHLEGTQLPATCALNNWFFKTDAVSAAEGIYWCTKPNTWRNVRAVPGPSASAFAAIQIAPGAARYRLIGLEVTHIPVPNPPPASWSQYPYKAGNFGSLIVVNETNDSVIIDRCDVHGRDYPSRLGAGIYLNGSNIGLVDSRVHKVNRWTEADNRSGSESTGIGIGEGPGPGHIENNLIEAIGVSLFFAGRSYHEPTPSDYVIRRNHFSHPDTYLYGSPTNVSRKNYMNRQLLELKTGRRMLIEGNIFDGNWVDISQGAMVLITPRAGLISAKTIQTINHGTITVSSTSEPFRPGVMVYISGTGSANHDGIYTVATVPSSNTFTILNPPQGAGSTGKVVAVAADTGISDVDIRNNVFRNGPNALWMVGHDNGTNPNTHILQRVRFVNNLMYGMDARGASAGGRVSPIGISPNGRSGCALYVALGMEGLTVRNNTVYDFRGNAPTFLCVDGTSNGANAGLDVRDNIYTATPAGLSLTTAGSGTEAFNALWTALPATAWTFTNNVLCCSPTAKTTSTTPTGNSWAPSLAAVGFANAAGGDFRLLPGSPYKAAHDPGINMDALENAIK